MEKEDFNKYLLIAFLVGVIYLSFIIIKPFISALLTSCILAYLSHPLYKKLKLIVKNEAVSAFIITILVIIIFLLPIVFIVNSISQETISLVKDGNIINKIQFFLSSYFNNQPTVGVITTDTITKVKSYIKTVAINFIFSIPSTLISLFITALALFYLLIVGEPFVNRIKYIIPIKKRSELVVHISNVTNAVVYGLFLSAIIQFIIALIALKILGSPSPFLFALIIGISAFIPFIGPAIIWVPLAILKLMDGDITKVIGFIILGVILSIIEHFIKAKIVQIRAKVHPIIVILGALGGVSIFGAIGFIVGPIILSSFMIILSDYFNLGGERNEIKS